MAIPEEIRNSRCPFCERSTPMGRQAKQLYEGWVCKKCVYAFANLRQFAYLVDLSIVGTLILAVKAAFRNAGIYLSLFSLPYPTSAPEGIVVLLFIFYVNIMFLPLYFKDGFGGRSPGKWLFGLTVVDDESQQPIGMVMSLVRNILMVIPFATLVGMGQMMGGRRLGDGLAKTRVIWDRYRHKFPMENRGYICRECGYDLRGSVSGKCSECGRAIPEGTAL